MSHDLYHLVSMQHQAHNIRTGYQPYKNLCKFVCKGIQRKKVEMPKMLQILTLNYKVVKRTNWEREIPLFSWTANSFWDCLFINAEVPLKECLFMKRRFANYFPNEMAWCQNLQWREEALNPLLTHNYSDGGLWLGSRPQVNFDAAKFTRLWCFCISAGDAAIFPVFLKPAMACHQTSLL